MKQKLVHWKREEETGDELGIELSDKEKREEEWRYK